MDASAENEMEEKEVSSLDVEKGGGMEGREEREKSRKTPRLMKKRGKNADTGMKGITEGQR